MSDKTSICLNFGDSDEDSDITLDEYFDSNTQDDAAIDEIVSNITETLPPQDFEPTDPLPEDIHISLEPNGGQTVSDSDKQSTDKQSTEKDKDDIVKSNCRKRFKGTAVLCGIIILFGIILIIVGCYKFKHRNDVPEDIRNTDFSVVSINPFDKIDVEFSGTNGAGTASVVNTNEGVMALLNVELSRNTGLSNGQTIRAVITDADSYPDYDITELTRDFTVEGLTGVSVADTGANDGYNAIVQSSLEYLKDYDHSLLKDDFRLELLGVYSVTGGYNEGLYVVYKFDLKSEEDSESLYQVVSYKDFTPKPDGSFSVNTDDVNLMGYVTDYGIVAFYDDEEKMFDVLTDKCSSYEISGSLTDFGANRHFDDEDETETVGSLIPTGKPVGFPAENYYDKQSLWFFAVICNGRRYKNG